ncbi:MAG: hypothetical protein WD404_04045 [Solirubrobacterales bacterium]
MGNRGSGPRAPLALLLAAALALGVMACGGDDDGSGAGAGSSAEEVEAKQAEADAEVRERNERVREEFRERQAAAAPSEEEQEAKRTATGFYEILGEERGGGEETTFDSAAFCELMSEQAREETVAFAKQASGEDKDWDCEAAIELLVLRAKQTGGFKAARQAKVLGVNAEGDRATATVRFGKGPATSISLVKEDGEWKLGSSLAGGGGSEGGGE